MRTTIRLDDWLAAQVRREAAAQGISVSAFVGRTLQAAFRRQSPAGPAKPFRLITVGGSGPRSGIDLDRPRAIDAVDDEACFGRRGS